MNTQVHLLSQSYALKHLNIIKAYIKDGVYCILIQIAGEKKVYKYPLCNIFRIVEDYE